MKKYLSALLVVAALGCNSETLTPPGATQPQIEPPKRDLFSVWNSDEGTSLDLTGLNFGPNPYFFTLPEGECECTLRLDGTQDAGQFTIENCKRVSGTVTDDSCDMILERSGVYEKGQLELKVCQGTDCENFR